MNATDIANLFPQTDALNIPFKAESKIDKRLTKVEISKLIDDIGVPFEHITAEEIDACVKQNILLTVNAIYNGSNDSFSYKNDKTYDLLKIATIVKEINAGTYNMNYPIPIWEDYDEDTGKVTYDDDGNGPHHIRAFYHCKESMYLAINQSG